MNQIVAMILLVIGQAWAKPQVGEVKYADGSFECTATFDISKNSKTKMENAAMLIFEVANTAPLKSVSLCNQKLNSKYKDCGSREFGDTNFLFNAEINAQENQKFIEKIESMEIPLEIEPIRKASLEDLRFEQWLLNQTFLYYSKRDESVFKNAIFPGTTPKDCLRLVDPLGKTKSTKEVTKIVNSWSNCINHQWRHPSSGIKDSQLKEAWSKLVIKENCKDESGDSVE